jgi:SAM-dependent methyltransferase
VRELGSDARLVASWQINASAWTRAVRERQIESRRLVTDAAIVDAVLGQAPRAVLDLGCGEGWLVRALAERGVRGMGVDAVPALIEAAAAAGGGDFRVASFEEIAAGGLEVAADVAVANFSLTGKECVEGLLQRVPSLLVPRGRLIVQTGHPSVVGGERPYADGWLEGSWAGFSADFSAPAPWYFRTLGGWVALLARSGLRLHELREPLDPRTHRPASLILIAEVGA